MRIQNIRARQILDSTGTPTVEADVILENGIMGRASVPSGSSTARHESIEVRDNDPRKFLGKGVLKAIKNINETIRPLLLGQNISEQAKIDSLMIEGDGTENKSRLGANAMLAVSIACAKAAAFMTGELLYSYINRSFASSDVEISLPLPLVNVINGGKHADYITDILEFMIITPNISTFSESLRISSEVYHTLGTLLHAKGYETTVGPEGGFSPRLKRSNDEAFELINSAIEKAGYTPGKDVYLGVDIAASEFYGKGKYQLKTSEKVLTYEDMVRWYETMIKKYNLIFLEDPFSEDDWSSWKSFNSIYSDKLMIVADDIVATNSKFIKKAVNEKVANSVMIKPNQVGTLTETFKTHQIASASGWNTVISHRSGDTEDPFIAHISVGLGNGFIKTGAPARSERVSKYNELLRIEEDLGQKQVFTSKSVFPFLLKK